METRTYHGEISPQNIAEAILGRFNRGNLIAQQIGEAEQVVVQVRTRQRPASGGQTALTITMQKIEDGVTVRIGKQAWLGIAASLGITALTTLRNPFSLIGRLDDLAQDFEHLQLSEEVWETISEVSKLTNASHLMSERLRRSTCEYCLTANPVGEPQCIACGAPLGEVQPITCTNCGFVVTQRHTICPNCSEPM